MLYVFVYTQLWLDCLLPRSFRTLLLIPVGFVQYLRRKDHGFKWFFIPGKNIKTLKLTLLVLKGMRIIFKIKECWRTFRQKRLKNNRWFEPILLIRLIVFLITRKWAFFFFTSVHFVSSVYDSEQKNTTHFIRKSTNLALFLKNPVVSGSSLHEFEMYYGCIFHLSIYCIIKKMERLSRDY